MQLSFGRSDRPATKRLLIFRLFIALLLPPGLFCQKIADSRQHPTDSNLFLSELKLLDDSLSRLSVCLRNVSLPMSHCRSLPSFRDTLLLSDEFLTTHANHQYDILYVETLHSVSKVRSLLAIVEVPSHSWRGLFVGDDFADVWAWVTAANWLAASGSLVRFVFVILYRISHELSFLDLRGVPVGGDVDTESVFGWDDAQEGCGDLSSPSVSLQCSFLWRRVSFVRIVNDAGFLASSREQVMYLTQKGLWSGRHVHTMPTHEAAGNTSMAFAVPYSGAHFDSIVMLGLLQRTACHEGGCENHPGGRVQQVACLLAAAFATLVHGIIGVRLKDIPDFAGATYAHLLARSQFLIRATFVQSLPAALRLVSAVSDGGRLWLYWFLILDSGFVMGLPDIHHLRAQLEFSAEALSDPFHNVGRTNLIRSVFGVEEQCSYVRSPRQLMWGHAMAGEETYWRHQLSDPLGKPWIQDALDPARPLQPALLRRIGWRTGERVVVLDVGSGPLTLVGSLLPDGGTADVVAVDPFAPTYNALLRRHGIQPLFPPMYGRAERLTQVFKRDSFDLVVSSNAIDHAEEPLVCLAEMLHVVRPGGWVVLVVFRNESEHNNEGGLHKWNFDVFPASAAAAPAAPAEGNDALVVWQWLERPHRQKTVFGIIRELGPLVGESSVEVRAGWDFAKWRGWEGLGPLEASSAATQREYLVVQLQKPLLVPSD